MQNPAMDQRIGEVRLADGTHIAFARACSAPRWCTCPGG